MISDYTGTWSIYVKDLDKNKEVVINDQPLYSASLIKALCHGRNAIENLDQVKKDEAKEAECH